MLGPFHGHALRHGAQRSLGHVVGQLALRDVDDEGAHGGDGDDAALDLVGDHVLGDCAAHEERASDVRVHQLVIGLLRHFLGGSMIGNTCVVDKDVNLAEVAGDVGDEAVDVGAVGDVGGIELAVNAFGTELFGGSLTGLGVSAADRKRRTGLRKILRDGKSDPAVAAGDNDDLALLAQLLIDGFHFKTPPFSEITKDVICDGRSFLV